MFSSFMRLVPQINLKAVGSFIRSLPHFFLTSSFTQSSGRQENERILTVLLPLPVFCRVLFPMAFVKYRDNCKAIFSLSFCVFSCFYPFTTHMIFLLSFDLLFYLSIFQCIKYVQNFFRLFLK